MEIKTLVYKNKNLSYTVAGAGFPVVLLHGFGEDSQVWHHQLNFLKDHYRIIVPDIAGSGASPLNGAISMEEIANMVHEIVMAESAVPFVLIGHSMGGYATLAFAAKYSHTLKGFGLFHSSAYADSEEKIATRRKGIAFINEHGATEFLKTATPNLFSEKTKTNDPALVSSYIQALPEFSNAALIAYYEAMIQRPDRTEVLVHTPLPVLFVIGKYDTAVPYEDGVKQSSLPQHAHVHILQHSGHLGMIEETAKTNEVLKSYVESVCTD